MARKQNWSIPTEDGEHLLSYSCSFWSGKSTLCIDGETFVQKLKPFHLGIERREVFRLGDEQCILSVAKNGRAEILYKGRTVPEL